MSEPPASSPQVLEALAQVLAPFGPILRGGLHPGVDDGAPQGVGTLLLIGNAGPALWRVFGQQRADSADPLNRCTEHAIRPLAARFGAQALFPFDGPPY